MSKRLRVNAPPASPPRTGLIVSARLPDEPDAAWTRGFHFEPAACMPSGRVSQCGGAERVIGANAAAVEVDPFAVWVGDECTTMAQARTPEAQARVRNALEACQWLQIEQELWTGSLARGETPNLPNPYLASPDVDDLGSAGAAVALQDALANLEEGLTLCSCGDQGMIHATVQTVTLWIGAGLVFRGDGGVLRTGIGTIVVAGPGYDGSGPSADGEADGAIDATGQTAWAYGTTMVDVRIERQVTVEPYVDRLNNTISVRASRLAAAAFSPCCLVGQNVDHAVRG